MINKELYSDWELAKRLQNGDLEAFDFIFKKYSSRLYGFAFKYLKSKVETEGLVQNVFLKIWENRKNIKKEANLKSYLFTIAYHEIAHLFKKKKIFLEITEANALSITSSEAVDEQLEYRNILEQVDKLINELPDKQRLIFIKSRKEGKSTKEIASELGIAPGTVDNNISAALKFIKQHMEHTNLAFLIFFSFFLN